MWKTYKKDRDITYAFGVYPTIEALRKRPKDVVGVLINPKGDRNEGVIKIVQLCKEHQIKVEENQGLINKLTSSENTYAVCAVKKYSTEIRKENNHVVLINPSDMGNLGTICRTMLAFDFTDLAITAPAADIFDPKVIRASMGAVFSLNIEMFPSLEEYKTRFQNNIYVLTGNGKTNLKQTTFKKPYALVFGNEGSGISTLVEDKYETISISQSSDVDSLNLATSVAIVLHEAFDKQVCIKLPPVDS
jgi:TrmH family RNA methyltransferase